MKLTLQQPDNIGALASTLCMIHCFATPFLFIAHSCSATCCATAPSWWRWIDYLFLIVSFFAVYRSAQTTSSNWMKNALWINWVVLLLVVMNERFLFVHLPKSVTYVVASAMVILHLYNRRYCQCKTDNCCTKQ